MPPSSDNAITLRGVVKRFGAITAVAGLDREVPAGSCVGLLELVRHAVFGFRGWVDIGHLAFLIGFALLMWRLAVRHMERELIL